MTPYGDRNWGQHWLKQWLVAWRHQAITWTNVDWSSVKSNDIHIRVISQEMPQPSITRICFTYLKFDSNVPGANAFFSCGLVYEINTESTYNACFNHCKSGTLRHYHKNFNKIIYGVILWVPHFVNYKLIVPPLHAYSINKIYEHMFNYLSTQRTALLMVQLYEFYSWQHTLRGVRNITSMCKLVVWLLLMGYVSPLHL